MSNTNIGIVLYNSANSDGTLDMRQKSLMVYKKVQWEDYPATTKFYNNMDVVMQKKGDNDVALGVYAKGLQQYCQYNVK